MRWLILLLSLLASPAFAQLPAIPAPGTPSVQFLSPPTGAWQQGAANINRFGDRLFLGDAYNSNTTNSPCGNDWFSLFQNTSDMLPSNGCGSYINYAVLSVLGGGNGQDPSSSTGIHTAVQSKNVPNNGAMISGINAFVVNNSTSHNSNAWAIYAECHVLNVGPSGSTCYAMEFDVRNMKASAAITDAYTQSTIVGIQAACGAGLYTTPGSPNTPGATGNPCGAAFQIVANDQPFGAGLVFHDGSITAGSAGTLNAINMPKAYRIIWNDASQSIAGSIYVGNSGNFNIDIAAGGTLVVQGNVGATCGGSVTAFFSVKNGIVVNC